jgi:branched-chain amino acid transport system permease protein
VLKEQFFQVVVTGLSQGGIYALVGLGFSLVSMATGILNLAQGSFAMWGGFLFLSLAGPLGLPLAAAFGIVLGIMAVLGVATEQIVCMRSRPWRPLSIDVAVLATLALMVVFEGAAFLIWGSDPHRGPPLQPGVFRVGGVVVVYQSLWMFIITILIAVALHQFLQRTWMGRAMRACAQNPSVAPLLGINLRRVGAVTFAMSAGLGALAGILISPVTWLDYQIAGYFMLQGLLAYLTGGEEKVAGPVIGGLLLGLLENVLLLAPGNAGGLLKQVVPMLILMAILVVRPEGLLTTRRART